MPALTFILNAFASRRGKKLAKHLKRCEGIQFQKNRKPQWWKAKIQIVGIRSGLILIDLHAM